MLLSQDAHPQEQEDDAVAGGGQCLDRVLHRCEAFLADVLESIMLRCHSKADDADDSRPDQKQALFIMKAENKISTLMIWVLTQNLKMYDQWKNLAQKKRESTNMKVV